MAFLKETSQPHSYEENLEFARAVLLNPQYMAIAKRTSAHHAEIVFVVDSAVGAEVTSRFNACC